MAFLGIPVAVYLCLPAAVFLYLILDLYPLVPKSASFMVKSGGFWLLWLVQCVLTLIAYAALRATAGARIDAGVGPGFSPFATVFLAVVGNLVFIQSFSLKIADHQLLDLQKPLLSFRTRVLEDITSKVADREKLRRMKLADRLYAKYQKDSQALREQYAHVMSLAGSDPEMIGKDLTRLQHESTVNNLSFERQLARKIAQVNMDWARNLIDS